jgi:hypothetical protein
MRSTVHNVLETYRSDFNDLVETSYRALYSLKPYSDKTPLITLHRYLSEYSDKTKIEREDLSQQLACLWLKYSADYDARRPAIHIRQYLIRLSVWGLRGWVKRQAHLEKLPAAFFLPEEKKEKDPYFNLDLKFLTQGTSFYPLSELSAYERYLIFLKFKEKKTILEIAYIVQHADDTVVIQYRDLMRKLRRLGKCQQEHKQNL